jgi:hypothetical protein
VVPAHVQNRPKYGEDVEGLDDINDARNGVFAAAQIHNGFDLRDIVVLKVCHICPSACPSSDPFVAANLQTPNHILAPEDIPPCHNRGVMPPEVGYPTHSRYTLQWLNPSVYVTALIRNNSDAAFKKRTGKPKPSDLLLHYNYGAAAVKCWGRNKRVLLNRANPPRPPVPVPAPTGPWRTANDRIAALSKRDAAQAADGAGAGDARAGTGSGELVESEGQAEWDEDDVMLFFWGNTRAARERHRKKTEESTQRMEEWRKDVSQVSV